MMNYRLFLIFLIIFPFLVYAETATVVGKVSFSKGSNAAQQPNATPRLLGKNAEIYQGDNIQTSDGSFVIVEFIDGSKITIRPNSSFKIDQFDSATKNAKLTVYEGGVRVTTGEFAKNGEDNFQIKTPTTTLKGEKDSDYTLQVCKTDCDKNGSKNKELEQASVAKIVEVKGNVIAKNREDKNADERELKNGASINQKDFLVSQADSYAVMVFRDGEKVTLQPKSEFDVVQYDFQQPNKKDQILFKLVSGGVRALTGSIGKKDHSAYMLQTPIATIGIRGTESETVIDDAVDINTGQAPVYNHVSEGAISVKNEAGEIILGQGESSVTASAGSSTEQVSSLPAKVGNQLNSTPSPKTAPNPDDAFSKNDSSAKSGTYATVNKGSAKLESNKPENKNDSKSSSPVTHDNSDSENHNERTESTALREGETSFSSETGASVEKLSETTPAMSSDENMPSPTSFENNQSLVVPLFSPTDGGAGCVVE